ncbi:MAG: hypothetical protein RR420_05465 [Anaerovoracaceae bacterium]
MINPQSIAQMMKLSPQDSTKLSQAWQKAQQIAQGVGDNPELASQALKKAGVSNEFLNKIKNWSNNPMAKVLASAAGIDINKIKTGINSLENENLEIPLNSPKANNNSDMSSNLAKLKNGLSQLK